MRFTQKPKGYNDRVSAQKTLFARVTWQAGVTRSEIGREKSSDLGRFSDSDHIRYTNEENKDQESLDKKVAENAKEHKGMFSRYVMAPVQSTHCLNFAPWRKKL